MVTSTSCPRSSEELFDAQLKKHTRTSWSQMAATSSQLTSRQNRTSSSERKMDPYVLQTSLTLWFRSISGPLSLQATQTPSHHTKAWKWRWSFIKWISRKISESNWRSIPLTFTETTRWRLRLPTFSAETSEHLSMTNGSTTGRLRGHLSQPVCSVLWTLELKDLLTTMLFPWVVAKRMPCSKTIRLWTRSSLICTR